MRTLVPKIDLPARQTNEPFVSNEWLKIVKGMIAAVATSPPPRVMMMAARAICGVGRDGATCA